MSEPLVPPRMVVFDLGGVLIRICRSWAEACAAAGLPVRGPSASHDASGRRHALAERHGTGAVSSEAFFSLVSESMSGLYSPQEVRRIHDAWLLGEYPGAGDLASAIREAGLTTGVLSNTNHAHWARLLPARCGGTGEFTVLENIEHLHASHLLGLLKPDPMIYRAFQRLCRCEDDPRHLLFFDDLAENVQAARACGWQAELIDHAGDPVAQMRGHLERRGVRLRPIGGTAR